jgi:predicted RNase H-like HicB family nuclease
MPLARGLLHQGDTIEEALANMQEAIELCLEDMQARGEEILDPSGVLVGTVAATH